MKSVIRKKMADPRNITNAKLAPQEGPSQQISHTSICPLVFTCILPAEGDAQYNTQWLWLPRGITNT